MTFTWIDADAWIQDWNAVEAYQDGASHTGFAATLESDPAYNHNDLRNVYRSSLAGFGNEYVERFGESAPLNAGVFAGLASAPHWHAWQQMIRANIHKADTAWSLFFWDQTALNIVCKQGLETTFLPTTCNWISHQAYPIVSSDGELLLRPLPPHQALGLVHQTGHTRRNFFALHRLGGGSMSRTLSYQAHSQLPSDDYVSPGLQVICLDQCFPTMVRGDQSLSNWPYLRRGLSHPWLVDRRYPSWGFLNRDEVHILYNLALRFQGKRALEIGCHMGWSACHMAAVGPGDS
jgi:hypothetical protein